MWSFQQTIPLLNIKLNIKCHTRFTFTVSTSVVVVILGKHLIGRLESLHFRNIGYKREITVFKYFILQ